MRIPSKSIFWILLMVLAFGQNSHAEFLTDRLGLGARVGMVDVPGDRDKGYSFDYGKTPLQFDLETKGIVAGGGLKYYF